VLASPAQVAGSPAATKRSFLERKGLTAAEIDEAFRRVPEDAFTSSAPPQQQAPAAAQQPQQYAQQQQQQHPQGALVPAQQQQLGAPPQEGYRWTQVRAAV
jgi:hypothetical protein